MPDAFPSACSLSIGGLGVTVECDDAGLVNGLCRRYRLFCGGGGGHLVARVQLTGRQRSSALLDTGVTFRENILCFTAPGYEGFINEEQGQARLFLSSAQPLEDVDYFVRVAFALVAFRAGGLLFHAAGIVRNGRGYVFFGHSGSGKTTVARLSPHDRILNDDLVLLLPVEQGGSWMIHATPFGNPTQLAPSGPMSAPLRAMFRLVQARQVRLEAMGRGQALAELVSNVPVIPADPVRGTRLLALGQQLLRAVPAYRLHFVLDDSFWSVIEEHLPDSP